MRGQRYFRIEGKVFLKRIDLTEHCKRRRPRLVNVIGQIYGSNGDV